ncbi:tetratricopeptide repeat protein [Massilia horti]|uniref:Tetratricopeptide repeat protein n=1 Tax=Massilia horti TaxID=2562153 RepID=A0A4Y9SWL0_9BURK|nr:tetratricopeptide repeat protein [Massilia horti]TFW30975.1 tetratricopeptide repeat protein [Massilia horti]
MSLINQMLQDLDARGTPVGESVQGHVKPVAPEERGLSKWGIKAAAVVGVAAIAAGGWVAWRYMHKPAPLPPPVMVVAPKPAPAPVVELPVPAPAPQVQQAAPSDEPAPDAAKDESAAEVRTSAREEEGEVAPKRKAKVAERKGKHAAASDAKAVAKKGKHAAASDAKPEPSSKKTKHEAVAQAAPRKDMRTAAVQGRHETTTQRAENAYRRALADLQEGRLTDAIAGLQRALQAEPRHEAARQTLVGLLVENKRNDEAIRQLQQALALDARQPSLAMLLARLQIEGGGTGIETLTKTLPYAAGNGEYYALLAGALQRQQRHHEAVEQYQTALRTQPKNGVWWMGLGIALQADKRNPDAVNAFQKAKESGTLSSELQAFVERRLTQLSR